VPLVDGVAPVAAAPLVAGVAPGAAAPVAVTPVAAVELAPAAGVPLAPEPLDWFAVPPPAAGRSGSDTSMYAAPADVGLPTTAIAAIHFAASRCESPK
jgi:hypothetical protein